MNKDNFKEGGLVPANTGEPIGILNVESSIPKEIIENTGKTGLKH